MEYRITIILLLSLVLTSCLNDPATKKTATPATQPAQVQTAPAKAVTTSQSVADSKPVSQERKSPTLSQKPTSAPQKTPPAAQSTTDVQTQVAKGQQQGTKGYSPEKAAERSRRQAGAEKKPIVAQKVAKPKVVDNPLPPTACSLLTEAFIGKVIGVDAGYITVKDGSGKAEHQRSCFFKWDHDGIANSGVLVQVQNNPVADEFPEWAAYFISAKKNQGDKAPDGSATYRYKDFPGLGEVGAYNYDLGRYYWRTKDDYVFMVAFNLPSSEAEQLLWAEKLGKEVMNNFKK